MGKNKYFLPSGVPCDVEGRPSSPDDVDVGEIVVPSSVVLNVPPV